MTDFLTLLVEWLLAAVVDFVNYYGLQLVSFPFSLASYALALVFFSIFLQIVLDIFKFLRAIANTIFFPLRVVHVWFHVEAATRIAMKRLEKGEANDALKLKPRMYFKTAISGLDDFSSIGISGPFTPKEAWVIASAPGAGSMFMMCVLVFLMPFLNTGLVGVLVHLYLFAGTALVMSPSSSDYHAVVHAVLLRSAMSPLYVLWSVAAFAIAFAVGLSATTDVVVGVAVGLTWSIIYLFAIVTLAVFLQPGMSQLNIIDSDSGQQVAELEKRAEEHFMFME